MRSENQTPKRTPSRMPNMNAKTPPTYNGHTSPPRRISSGGINPTAQTRVAGAGISRTAAQSGKRRKKTVFKAIRRTLLVILTIVVLLVYALFAALGTVAHGPSESVRNLLVLSALQASATKWVPGLFLDGETVNQILEASKIVSTDTISLDDYSPAQGNSEAADKWAKAKDGMIFDTLNGSTYKAYVLVVKDPARVIVGTSSDYTSAKYGKNIFQIAEKYSAIAAINGGEFQDPGGVGTGAKPIGITYSQGALAWSDGHTDRTFIGFDSDNKLVVSEGMTKAKADELKIRDAVSFQTGNVLITSKDGEVTLYYADDNIGTAQRTAIGQAADGSVILLVTDGRTASSLGATHNDVIDIMVSYGAVTAGMLDGGSSAMMYYRDYFDKYEYDFNTLDKYQQQGLVNKYKAFTTPRYMPTFFVVTGE